MTIFCPKCGNAVQDGLKFCNSCGQRLRRERPRDGGNNAPLLIVLGAATVIAIFGFGGLIGFVALLLKNAANEELIGMAIAMWLFVIVLLDVMLIRKASKLIDNNITNNADEIEMPSAEKTSAPLLKRRSTAQLEEHREPASSVVEHTTRMLDKEPFRER
jgi:hypothetical protein